MPAKIRLQRKGKKGQAFYHIVIADGRAPRDGKFIERIGTYNPLTKPADINLDFDRALYWLQSGAQPTDTVKAILSYKGVLMKNHLLIGAKKGALTQEQVEVKFAAWLKEKEEKISSKVKEVENKSREEQKKRMDEERKVNEARAKELSDRRAAELKKMEAEKAPAAPVPEEAPADVVVTEDGTPAVESVQETAGEKTDSGVTDAAEIDVKEEPAEEAVAEAAAEPAEEKTTEESPEPEEGKKEDAGA